MMKFLKSLTFNKYFTGKPKVKTLVAVLIIMTFFGCDRNYESKKEVKISMETKSYSDVIKFQILPGMGPGKIKTEGDTADLLRAIPYLFSSGVIPPINIINEVLAKGLDDAGMSGGARWTPYQVDPNDFEELVLELITSEHNESLEYIEPDSWVSNYKDWHVWVMYIKGGIPWKEHKRLNDIYISLEREMKEAQANGDEQRIMALHLKTIEAGTNLADFIMKYSP